MKDISVGTARATRLMAIMLVGACPLAVGLMGCASDSRDIQRAAEYRDGHEPAAEIGATPPGKPAAHVSFRKVEASTVLLGVEVRNPQDEKLGKIKALALDLEHGRVVEVLVSSGGFLGMGQRIVAVPPKALMFDPIGGTADPAGGVYRLNMGQRKFKAAPEFVLSQWAEYCQSRHVAEAYRYCGEEPYFAADGEASRSGNTATEPLGYIQRASKLMYLPINNLQNEPLGLVDNFLYDLPRGRVLHVIVVAPGFIKTKRVIPARALRFNAAHDALCMDVSLRAFQDEPRFKWAYGEHGDVTGHYRQETYSNTTVAANQGVNTRQNVQEGYASDYTPLMQGSSFADVDRTHRIYVAMRADASLSENAQGVEVGTLNGRMTLRGHVNTEEGKRAIGAIAAMVGRPENVSNLLEIRPVPVPKTAAN